MFGIIVLVDMMTVARFCPSHLTAEEVKMAATLAINCLRLRVDAAANGDFSRCLTLKNVSNAQNILSCDR